ncbi:hypothetical protein [Nonomuraea jabiensis]|uniref:hypothetical protein n=1 Tax=Nonomuraea jabiensis TaxID=882448 RepID=UPI003D74158D
MPVRPEHFAVPMWRTRWHPARLRTILASRQLTATTAVIPFPVTITGSDKAPERRAGTGQLHPIRSPQ